MNEQFLWKFTILGKPISQKNSKRVGLTKGRGYMYTPANVKAWHKSAVHQLEVQLLESQDPDAQLVPAIPDKTEMEIRITSYLDKGQAIDVDNLAAAPLDAMQRAGVYKNDYWARCVISSRKKDWGNPRVEIEITKYRED
tara:strand:- start:1805 stop:2224 length:420 start_codon:yes stop_codon:yes gene_type:complete